MKLKKLAFLSALGLALVLALMIFSGRRAQAAGTWYVSVTGVPTGVSGGSCSNPVSPRPQSRKARLGSV